MSEIIVPIAKKVFVCDDLFQDPASGRSSLLNLWDTIPIQEDAFPYCHKKISVFARLRGGSGNVPVHLEISQAATGEMIRRTPNFILPFLDRTKAYDFICSIVDLIFPTPGVYFVEMYCNNEFVDDQAIRVASR